MVEAYLLGWEMSTFSQCLHIVLPSSMPMSSPLSDEDISPVELWPTLMTHFSLIVSLRILSPNTVTFLILGDRTSTYELCRGHNSAHHRKEA